MQLRHTKYCSGLIYQTSRQGVIECDSTNPDARTGGTGKSHRYFLDSLIRSLIVTVCLLSLIGCPQKEIKEKVKESRFSGTNSITDATDITFILPVKNQRVVSLAPSITENIKTIGGLDKLVGRTDFCKVGPNIGSVGTILEPSLEKIVALSPDLILATREANRPHTVIRLRELGISVFVFGESNSWKDIASNFRLCAKLLDKTTEAEEILKTIKLELETTTITPTSPAEIKRVFIQLSIMPLMTAGRNTFINEMLKYAPANNIASDSILPWPTLNIEEVIQRNPDVIIISDMGQITAEAQKMWTEERFAGINAIKNNKIFLMESDLLCQPTPINFIKAVRKMRELMK
ncbi:MAG: helical backbone metal receptor [Planctomycetota bacterium]|nr:helical backbone metal receptor [Planctomycetota bacterium]MDI6787040.1 helical backbone metal receptor [Planctomycetota bacterium]